MYEKYAISHEIVNKLGSKKTLTTKERENIKALIKHCEIFRYSEEETMEYLEDHEINIERTTLYSLKKEMREDMKKRFEEIGGHELAYEHDLALKVLSKLEPKVWGIINNAEKDGDRLHAISEMRAIKRDMLDFYGSSEIVKNVVAYFEDKYGEKAKEAAKEVGL